MSAIRSRPGSMLGTAIFALLLAGEALAQAADPAPAAIPVEVQRLSEVLVDMNYSAPAEVRSLNASTVSAEVTAVVRQVWADVGQNVRRGQKLVELDATDYQLALNQAEASLAASRAQKAQADARLKRARELGAKQYMSADDLLSRETDVSVAAAQIKVLEASLAIARRNLEKCLIVAPYDGAVDERWAQVGAYVTPGTPLVGLVQTDRFELDADIPDELADTLGRATAMRFDSQGESWTVELIRLSPVIFTERRTRHARFGFAELAPPVGRSGEIVWSLEQGMLPVSLVVRRGGQLGVFLNRSGVATFESLPQAQEGRPVPVDLPLDTEIVVQGRERLQDGDRIEPSRPASR